MLKEQLEATPSPELKANLATFFLPQLEKLLPHADSSVKPLLLQASSSSPSLTASCVLTASPGVNVRLS